MDEAIKVYVKIDDSNRVIDCNSSIFWKNTANCIQIDEWTEGKDRDKFVLAQNQYLPMALKEENGIFRYKYADGVLSERTADEMQADINSLPPAPPTLSEQLQTLSVSINNTKVGMATLGASVVSRIEDVETDIKTLEGVE